MIDLRKPLVGVPGLLLMAALIFFGAGVGIAFALGFTWIPMSDALANFLGGVVGAGLGAALAVIGAVYVQRRDAWDRARKPAHTISRRLYWLGRRIGGTLIIWDGMKNYDGKWFEHGLPNLLLHLRSIEKEVDSIPDGEELPWEVHQEVLHVKELVRWFTGTWSSRFGGAHVPKELSEHCWQTLGEAREAIEKLQRHLPKFTPAVEVDH